MNPLQQAAQARLDEQRARTAQGQTPAFSGVKQAAPAIGSILGAIVGGLASGGAGIAPGAAIGGSVGSAIQGDPNAPLKGAQGMDMWRKMQEQDITKSAILNTRI